MAKEPKEGGTTSELSDAKEKIFTKEMYTILLDRCYAIGVNELASMVETFKHLIINEEVE